VRHVRHHSARPKTPPVRPQHHTTPPPASTYVAHAYRSSPEPTYHPTVSSPTPRIVTSSHRSAATTSSRATVSATGQNGALGPVQSPNG
jgi:hypothetical protein